MRIEDTHPAVAARMDAAYRSMQGGEKLARAAALTGLAHGLALARIRAEHPDESPREHRLRLVSRWLTREQMVTVFGWDPSAHR